MLAHRFVQPGFAGLARTSSLRLPLLLKSKLPRPCLRAFSQQPARQSIVAQPSVTPLFPKSERFRRFEQAFATNGIVQIFWFWGQNLPDAVLSTSIYQSAARWARNRYSDAAFHMLEEIESTAAVLLNVAGYSSRSLPKLRKLLEPILPSSHTTLLDWAKSVTILRSIPIILQLVNNPRAKIEWNANLKEKSSRQEWEQYGYCGDIVMSQDVTDEDIPKLLSMYIESNKGKVAIGLSRVKVIE